jgi:hypothetical protein
MKDAYEALKQKEADLSRVRHELESLRIVASLLVDDSNLVDSNSDESDEPDLVSTEQSDNFHPDLEPTGTDGLFSSMIAAPRSSLWKILKRAK